VAAEKRNAEKQVERDRVQKLKDEGKWLTPAQLKKKRALEAKRADLIARGIIKEGEDEEDDG
jgi:acetyl-CoA carboxylase carboxyltransferase component|tara:strand:+ start:75 stop:260 length:186 start_codon:yes stop_codon:yes gene_type:complete